MKETNVGVPEAVAAGGEAQCSVCNVTATLSAIYATPTASDATSPQVLDHIPVGEFAAILHPTLAVFERLDEFADVFNREFNCPWSL